MGTSGRRALPSSPPAPSSTTSQEEGRGRLAPTPEGWDSGSRPGGRAWTPGSGRGEGRCGAAAPAFWACSRVRVGSRGPVYAALFVPVTRSSLPVSGAAGVGVRAGWAGGGRRRHRKLWETCLAAAGKWPGRGMISWGGLEGTTRQIGKKFIEWERSGD